MFIELQECLQQVDRVRGTPDRSGGTWSEERMAHEAGDGARRV
jgi:hypothetical protein